MARGRCFRSFIYLSFSEAEFEEDRHNQEMAANLGSNDDMEVAGEDEMPSSTSSECQCSGTWKSSSKDDPSIGNKRAYGSGYTLEFSDGPEPDIREFDPRVARRMFVEAILRHDLPYSFVESEIFQRLVENLNPDFVLPSRKSVVADVSQIYLQEKEKLKKILATIPKRVCLTFDLCTTSTTEEYLSLSAQFVDENWKLCSKFLDFCDMPTPHSGEELASTIFGCLMEWGIDKKVFSVTLDNATANNNMQDFMKYHLGLQNSLFFNGEYFHLRCCSRVFDLIAEEGLKTVNTPLFKIRESVKYVKASDEKMEEFQECAQQVDINVDVELCLDDPTRWSSTYLMLDSALKYQRAFASPLC